MEMRAHLIKRKIDTNKTKAKERERAREKVEEKRNMNTTP